MRAGFRCASFGLGILLGCARVLYGGDAAARDGCSSAADCGKLGFRLLQAGEYRAALDSFLRADHLTPRDASILFGLLQAQLALGEFDESAKTADQICVLSPDRPEVFNRLAGVQAQQGDYAHAAANFERSLALNSADETTRYNLGLAYFKAGQNERARAALEPLERETAGADVENLLGDVYEKAGLRSKALAALQRAAKEEPGNEDYRFDYIVELMRVQGPAAAAGLAEKGISDFPHSLRMKLAYGIALFGLEQFSKARTIVAGAAKDYPDSELALRVLVFSSEASRDQLPETELLVERYLHSHVDDPIPYYLAGRLALIENQPAKAIPLLAQSIALESGVAEAWLELGRAKEISGDKTGAAVCLERASRLNPQSSEVWYRLGRLLKSTGRNQEAAAALVKFRELRSRENASSSLAGILDALH